MAPLSIPNTTILLSGTMNPADTQVIVTKKGISVIADGTDTKRANSPQGSRYPYVDDWEFKAFSQTKITRDYGLHLQSSQHHDVTNVGTVPIPPSMLLLAPGLLGLIGIRKRLKG